MQALDFFQTCKKKKVQKGRKTLKKIATYHLFSYTQMYLTVIEQQKLCSRVISVICSVISVICSHLIVDNHCHIGNRPIWHHAISVSGGKFVAISGLVIFGSEIVMPIGKQWLIFFNIFFSFFFGFMTNLQFFAGFTDLWNPYFYCDDKPPGIWWDDFCSRLAPSSQRRKSTIAFRRKSEQFHFRHK